MSSTVLTISLDVAVKTLILLNVYIFNVNLAFALLIFFVYQYYLYIDAYLRAIALSKVLNRHNKANKSDE